MNKVIFVFKPVKPFGCMLSQPLLYWPFLMCGRILKYIKQCIGSNAVKSVTSVTKLNLVLKLLSVEMVKVVFMTVN